MKFLLTLLVIALIALAFTFTTMAKAEPTPFDVEPNIEDLIKWEVIYTGPTWGPVYMQIVEKDDYRALIIKESGYDMPVGYSFMLRSGIKSIEFIDGEWTEVTDQLDPRTYNWINDLLRMDDPSERLFPERVREGINI